MWDVKIQQKLNFALVGVTGRDITKLYDPRVIPLTTDLMQLTQTNCDRIQLKVCRKRILLNSEFIHGIIDLIGTNNWWYDAKEILDALARTHSHSFIYLVKKNHSVLPLHLKKYFSFLPLTITISLLYTCISTAVLYLLMILTWLAVTV